ncbi:hypothetical protein [Beijerinckia indica]|uniref:hypothetical protein n=1 Tax=Beijerinckia indica TaxID=533 RepID=UPI0011D15FC9|nr:hypothetical protein [Beijerinckia indica]
MKTRLWADVPEAKDFVRENRPAPNTLDFTPLTGASPTRPRIKSKEEIEALKSELDQAAAQSRSRAGLAPPSAKPSPGKPKSAHP